MQMQSNPAVIRRVGYGGYAVQLFRRWITYNLSSNLYQMLRVR